jgi:hypothetical protein
LLPARDRTPADLLIKIGLHQYFKTFEDISSDELLELVQSVDNLSEMGVTSSLHQMKIMQLFLRELRGTKAEHSCADLCQFLSEQKIIAQYRPILQEHGIDGDMILQVEHELMNSVLKEIGIASALHRSRICLQFKARK